LRGPVNTCLSPDLIVALTRPTGDGGTALLPLEDDVASANPAGESAFKISGMIQHVYHRVDHEGVHRKLLFEFTLDIPKGVSVDSSWIRFWSRKTQPGICSCRSW
jgi:hypothetical protein